MDRQLEARHLHVLIALADEGTFTDAAIALGISQSAVSRTLGQFEELVGVRLIDRTTRALSLTETGQRLVPASLEALRALAAVREAAAGIHRPLRLGFSWGALGRHTSAVLQTWRRQHPDVPLEVHRIDFRDAGVRRGAVDLAIVRGDLPPVHPGAPQPVTEGPTKPASGELESVVLFHEARFIVVPRGHRLAALAAPALADLAGEVLAVTPSTGTTSASLWQPGAGPVRLLRCQNLDEWLTAIAAGQAVGVSTEATAFAHPHPDVTYCRAVGAPSVPVRLVWRAHSVHPGAAAFRELIRSTVAAQARSASSAEHTDPGDLVTDRPGR